MPKQSMKIMYRKKRYTNYRRVPRPISKTTGMSLTTEVYDQIGQPSVITAVQFVSTGLVFRNIDNIISSSNSFSKYSTLYSKMKIVAIQAIGNPQRGLTQNNLSDIVLSFYPNFKSTANLPGDIAGHDEGIYLPIGTDRTHRYIKYFKDDFYQGADGTGYGVWFSPSKLSSLDGQFAVAAVRSVISSVSPIIWHNLVLKVTIRFSDPIF